jgi:hypothetical protein
MKGKTGQAETAKSSFNSCNWSRIGQSVVLGDNGPNRPSKPGVAYRAFTVKHPASDGARDKPAKG